MLNIVFKHIHIINEELLLQNWSGLLD